MAERGERRPDASSGAMTGATGALTPDDLEEPFIPAETREIADPDPARVITSDQPGRADDDPD